MQALTKPLFLLHFNEPPTSMLRLEVVGQLSLLGTEKQKVPGSSPTQGGTLEVGDHAQAPPRNPHPSWQDETEIKDVWREKLMFTFWK